jgi:hypothetical protein
MAPFGQVSGVETLTARWVVTKTVTPELLRIGLNHCIVCKVKCGIVPEQVPSLMGTRKVTKIPYMSRW